MFNETTEQHCENKKKRYDIRALVVCSCQCRSEAMHAAYAIRSLTHKKERKILDGKMIVWECIERILRNLNGRLIYF